MFQKYGLASDIDAWIGRYSRKAMMARLLTPAKLERYEGSRDGALAFKRGETALAREGLD